MIRGNAVASIMFSVSLVVGCSGSVTEPTDQQAEINSINKKERCEKGECPCDSSLGSIAHGSRVTVYSKAEVACEESCGSFSADRICNNGQWDRTLDGMSFTCQVTECDSCQVGNNLVRHGEAIEMFTATEADCNQSCEDLKAVRRCTNGVLTGEDRFKEPSCSPRQCRCRLPDESGFLSLGGTIDLFSVAEADCGKTCADYKASRTCTSAGTGASRTFTFSGESNFKFASCEAATGCFCTLPNSLGVIARGETARISSQQTAPCGSACSAANEISVRCERGQLKNISTNQVVDPATTPFKFKCAVQECQLCALPDGTRVTENTKVLFYKEADPACGSPTCASNSRLRTCKNGAFDGDPTFAQQVCADRSCRCNWPDFSYISSKVNESKVFYDTQAAPCGTTCAARSQSRTCIESGSAGNWTYAFNGSSTFRFSDCSPPTNCACPMPPGIPDLVNGASAELSSVAIAACGTTCDSVDKINVTCSNGALRKLGGEIVDINAPGFAYIHSCKVAACQQCVLQGYSPSIQSGQSVVLFSKQQLNCGEIRQQFQYTFTCDNAILKRDGAVYNPADDPHRPASWYSSIQECPGCPLPWGGSLAEGTSIMAYFLVNDVGNNCGAGCRAQERRCVGGVLTGDPAYNRATCNNSCSQEGGGAPPRACLLPWSNSYVTPDSLIPMWSKRTVPCGDSCQNHFRVGKCDMRTGRFDAPLEFIYQSCTELCD